MCEFDFWTNWTQLDKSLNPYELKNTYYTEVTQASHI